MTFQLQMLNYSCLRFLIQESSNNKRMVRILVTLPDHPSIARLYPAAAGCVD
jgi:hypothetical protein